MYLLLVGYSGIMQMFLGWVLGTVWKKMHKDGVLAGLVAGIIVVIITTFVYKNPFGIYSGLWGLMVNLPIAVGISLLKGGKQ